MIMKEGEFAVWACEIAAGYDGSDREKKLIFDRTERSPDDGTWEAWFHDEAVVYVVRDEPGARLEYVCSR